MNKHTLENMARLVAKIRELSYQIDDEQSEELSAQIADITYVLDGMLIANGLDFEFGSPEDAFLSELDEFEEQEGLRITINEAGLEFGDPPAFQEQLSISSDAYFEAISEKYEVAEADVVLFAQSLGLNIESLDDIEEEDWVSIENEMRFLDKEGELESYFSFIEQEALRETTKDEHAEKTTQAIQETIEKFLRSQK